MTIKIYQAVSPKSRYPALILRWWRWRVLNLVAALGLFQVGSGEASQFVVQLTSLFADPEILTVNQGDTVLFVWSDSSLSGFAVSYSGGWTSPVMTLGQTFSHTFTNPGRDVYKLGSSIGLSFPGMVNVNPIIGAPPAVWITSPLDGFMVPGYATIGAATTNSPDSVRFISFYANGQFVGNATNPPYGVTVEYSTSLGTYKFTASVVDTQGRTNTSAPITITFVNPDVRLFQPWQLPGGQTVLFESGTGPWCLKWSADLRAWNLRTLGQLFGKSMVIDEGTTNLTQRFYYIEFCLGASSALEWPRELNGAGFPVVSKPILAAPP